MTRYHQAVESITCAECNIQLNSYQSLSKHVKHIHKLTSQEYYDKYFGIKYCEVCGEISKFNEVFDI